MEFAKLIIQIVSALLILGGLIYAAKQFVLATKVFRDLHEWNRRSLAQQAIINYASKSSGGEKLNSALKYLTAKDPIDLTIIDKAFDSDDSLIPITHQLLNYHESLAIGVLEGIYDEMVIKAGRHEAMELLFNALSLYIKRFRSNLQPTAWIEQEKLLNKWRYERDPFDPRNRTGNTG